MTDEIPFQFFATSGVTLSNISQDADVLISDSVPQGFKAVLRDVNVIFTTSGGTIAYEKVLKGGGRAGFAASITANSNGSFDMVFGSGEKVAIVVTSTGDGVLDVTFDGVLIPIRIPELPQEPFPSNEIGIAAGGGL